MDLGIFARAGAVALLAGSIAACGGGGDSGGGDGGGGGTNTGGQPGGNNPATFAIVGSISGLNGTVVLQNNAGDALTISANGPFSFATPLPSGASYLVTVQTQPSGQQCLVSGGAGTIAGNTTNVSVTCSALPGPGPSVFFVGGTVSGLVGSLTLGNNGGDAVSISADGSFKFATPLSNAASYQATVLAQPANQECTVSAGSGVIAGANVTNIGVTCNDLTYTVGGNVSGLVGTVVLKDNGGDSLPVSANGPFTFATPLANGAMYQVTVSTQPAAQQCTVSSGSGSIAASAVTTVAVTCKSFHTVGGTTSGLAGTAVLQNNGGDDLTVSAGNPFTFATALLAGATYEVSVLTQPPSQFCRVLNGNGTVATADVASVRVVCNTLRTSKYLYQVSTGLLNNPTPQTPNGVLSQFTVGSDGTLAPMTQATVATGTGASSVAVDPSGKFAYVTNSNGDGSNGTVWQYTIGTDGGLVPMNPATVDAGINPVGAVVDPKGKYLYVANRGAVIFVGSSIVSEVDGSISQYAIAAGGQLVPLTPDAKATGGSNPSSISVDPSGQYVYAVANVSTPASGPLGGSFVLQYTIGSDGALTPMTPASLDTGFPIARAIVADPFGRMVYATESLFGGVLEYAIGDGGALNFKDSVLAATMGAASFTIDPTGAVGYVGSGASIGRYTVNSDGTLNRLPDPAFVDSVVCIAADLSAKYAYACSGDPQNKLVQYSIGSDAALVPLTPPSLDVPVGPASIAISP